MQLKNWEFVTMSLNPMQLRNCSNSQQSSETYLPLIFILMIKYIIEDPKKENYKISIKYSADVFSLDADNEKANKVI